MSTLRLRVHALHGAVHLRKKPFLSQTACVQVKLRPISFHQIHSDCNLQARLSITTSAPRNPENERNFEDFRQNEIHSQDRNHLRVSRSEIRVSSINISYAQPNSIPLLGM